MTTITDDSKEADSIEKIKTDVQSKVKWRRMIRY